MMTYREAVNYIEEIPKFAVKHPKEHTREFLKRLGNPEQGLRIIHVAGTNGKGSVCAYMQAMLMAEGKRIIGLLPLSPPPVRASPAENLHMISAIPE